MVRDAREAAHALEGLALEDERGAEGVPLPDELRGQHQRDEVAVDEDRLDHRRQAEEAAAAVEAGGEPHLLARERRDRAAEIVGTDADVGVGERQHRVLRVLHHVPEVRHLAVHARSVADRQHDVAMGEVALDLPDDVDGGIVRVGDAADDLVLGIVLAAEAREVRVEVDAAALERLQDRDRRAIVLDTRGATAGAPEERAARDELEELVPGRDDRKRQHEPDDDRHQACAAASLRPVGACSIPRRLIIERMNSLPSPSMRAPSFGSRAIFFTDFQM